MKLMRCNRLQDHLAFASEEDPLSAEMTAHLASCESCREAWSEFTEMRRRMSEAWETREAPFVQASSGVRGVRNRIEASRSSAGALPDARIRRINYGLALCAGIAIHLALRPLYGRRSASSLTATTTPARIAAIPSSKNAAPAPPDRVPSNRDGSSATSDRFAFVSPRREMPDRPRRRNSRKEMNPPSADENRTASEESGRIAESASSPALRVARTMDDLAFINSPLKRSPIKRITKVASDENFILPELPSIAANDAPATRNLIAEAVKDYNQEKAVVDPRLTEKIDLSLKAGDLKELTDDLTQKTGISFYVDHEFENWKLTVLTDQTPIRDIMHQVALLFDMKWRRKGEAPKYEYVLTQELQDRLNEEDQKRKNQDQMVVNIDNEMNRYRQSVDLTSEQLDALARQAKDRAMTAGSVEARAKALSDARMYQTLSDPRGQAGVRLYDQLAPDQRVALRNNGDITLSSDDLARILPPSLLDRLKGDQAQAFSSFGPGALKLGADGKPELEAHLGIDYSHLDQAQLSVNMRAYIDENANVPGMSSHASMDYGQTLISGEPDRLLNPNNAGDHADLRGNPEYAKTYSVEPRPLNPAPLGVDSKARQELTRLWGVEHSFAGFENPTAEGQAIPIGSKDWIDSADLFQELHEKTGRNIVADYYLQVYPRTSLDFAKTKLLNLLNDAADELKSSWDEDGDILRFRRFDYFSQRLQDIPNKDLKRWKAARDQRGYLGLDELSEIYALSDNIKKDVQIERTIIVKWGLQEWPLAVGLAANPMLKIYGALNPTQRRETQSDEGLSFADMTADQRNAILNSGLYVKRGINESDLGYHRLYMKMREPGHYSWNPMTTTLVSPGKEMFYETDYGKITSEVRNYVSAHPEMQADIVKSLPDVQRWRPDATADSQILGQIKGPDALMWTSVQSGSEYRCIYQGIP